MDLIAFFLTCLGGGFQCADKFAVTVHKSHLVSVGLVQLIWQISDAVVQKGLHMAWEEGELLDIQILSILHLVEAFLVHLAQEQVAWLSLVVQWQIDDFLWGDFHLVLVQMLIRFPFCHSQLNFKSEPLFSLVIKFTPKLKMREGLMDFRHHG